MSLKPEHLHLVPDLEKQYCFSIGVRAGDYVFIGGLTASDDDGNELFADDPALQMKNIYEQMAADTFASTGNMAEKLKAAAAAIQ